MFSGASTLCLYAGCGRKKMQKHQSYPLAPGKCSPAAKDGEPRGKRSRINREKGRNILQEWSPLGWQLGIIKSSPKHPSGTGWAPPHWWQSRICLTGVLWVTFPKGLAPWTPILSRLFALIPHWLSEHQQSHHTSKTTFPGRAELSGFPNDGVRRKWGQKLKPRSQWCFPGANSKLPAWDEASSPDRPSASK